MKTRVFFAAAVAAFSASVSLGQFLGETTPQLVSVELVVGKAASDGKFVVRHFHLNGSMLDLLTNEEIGRMVRRVALDPVGSFGLQVDRPNEVIDLAFAADPSPPTLVIPEPPVRGSIVKPAMAPAQKPQRSKLSGSRGRARLIRGRH